MIYVAYNYILCVLSYINLHVFMGTRFFFSSHRPWILNIFPHKLIFRAFGCCALLWCTTATSPFLWLTQWQMCKCFPLSSVYKARQAEMRSASVDAGQWNSVKAHSKPFILCCWNNNVSRDPQPPRLNIWKNMCTSSTWLATFQHRRLHHLTSSKQLKGFIAWQATARWHGVQQWHMPVIWNGIFF